MKFIENDENKLSYINCGAALSRIDEYSFDESHKENNSHLDFRSDLDEDDNIDNFNKASRHSS